MVLKKNNVGMIGGIVAVVGITSGIIGFLFAKGTETPAERWDMTRPNQQAANQQTVTQNLTTNQRPVQQVTPTPPPAPAFVCGESTVQDADGNMYGTVAVGSQCWMSENMRVGTKIAGKTEQKDNGINEKWCASEKDTNCSESGGLYTWYESMRYATSEQAQGICPTNFHIPTDSELYVLENSLKDSGKPCVETRVGDDCASAGIKLVSGGTSGLNFRLAGSRSANGTFAGYNGYTNVWSSSGSGGASAWSRTMTPADIMINRDSDSKSNGFSVRCLKD
jgi:uncharacterized protein (TIGR02145 family)